MRLDLPRHATAFVWNSMESFGVSNIEFIAGTFSEVGKGQLEAQIPQLFGPCRKFESSSLTAVAHQ